MYCVRVNSFFQNQQKSALCQHILIKGLLIFPWAAVLGIFLSKHVLFTGCTPLYPTHLVSSSSSSLSSPLWNLPSPPLPLPMLSSEPEPVAPKPVTKKQSQPSQEDISQLAGVHMNLSKSEVSFVFTINVLTNSFYCFWKVSNLMLNYVNQEGAYLVRPSVSSQGLFTISVMYVVV